MRSNHSTELWSSRKCVYISKNSWVLTLMLEGCSCRVYRPRVERRVSGAVQQWRSVIMVQRLFTLKASWLQGYSVLMRSVPGPQGQIILPHVLPCPASCRLQPGLVSIQTAALHFRLQSLPTPWGYGRPNWSTQACSHASRKLDF